MLGRLLLVFIVCITFVYGDMSLSEAFAKLRYNRKLLTNDAPSFEAEVKALLKKKTISQEISDELRSECNSNFIGDKETQYKCFYEKLLNAEAETLHYSHGKHMKNEFKANTVLPVRYNKQCGVTILDKDMNPLYQTDSPNTFFQEKLNKKGEKVAMEKKFDCMVVVIYEPSGRIKSFKKVPTKPNGKIFPLFDGQRLGTIQSGNSFGFEAATYFDYDMNDEKELLHKVNSHGTIFYIVSQSKNDIFDQDGILQRALHSKGYNQGNTIFYMNYNDGYNAILVNNLQKNTGFKIPKDIITSSYYNGYIDYLNFNYIQLTTLVSKLKIDLHISGDETKQTQEQLEETKNKARVDLRALERIINGLHTTVKEKQQAYDTLQVQQQQAEIDAAETEMRLLQTQAENQAMRFAQKTAQQKAFIQKAKQESEEQSEVIRHEDEAVGDIVGKYQDKEFAT